MKTKLTLHGEILGVRLASKKKKRELSEKVLSDFIKFLKFETAF
jgi:hypothetical protein